MNRLLTKTEDIMTLSDKIRNCNVIKKHDKPGSKRDPEAWVKKSSTHFRTKDGASFETHWVENIKTGERVELKTLFK